MRYGLPYMGSKNHIARQIVEALPPATHFYDVFAGGCAVAHAAILSGKYKYIHLNDVDNMPRLFADAVAGKYAHETRWISREDFFALKDTDPYVKSIWSFGNAGKNYMFGRHVEPFKKALHYAVVFHDYTLIDKYDPQIKTLFDKNKSIRENRLAWRTHCHRFIKDSVRADGKHWAAPQHRINEFLQLEQLKDTLYFSQERKVEAALGEIRLREKCNGAACHAEFISASNLPNEIPKPVRNDKSAVQNDTQNLECLRSLSQLQRLQQLERLERLEQLQQLERLEQLQQLKDTLYFSQERKVEAALGEIRLREKCNGAACHAEFISASSLPNEIPKPVRNDKSAVPQEKSFLSITQGDYRNLSFEKDSVIYCDPPYIGTKGYACGSFDHAAFYEWCLRQQNIYISEYTMPAEFTSIWQKDKRVTLTMQRNSGGSLYKTECLFVPKAQAQAAQELRPATYEQLELFDF